MGIARFLRHRWLDEGDARRMLGAGALERVEQRVRASEQRHSGEVRVCVEAGLPLGYLWKGLGAHARAVTLFGKLRIWDTEHNNGVLIYLLLADHAIEVVADRGITRHVEPQRWQQIVGAMREDFRAGRFEEGLNAAIDAVDGLLVSHYPLAPGQRNPNELPDVPDLR
ncbi:TPM domain-containing protein [Rivibacter subsaxonicus]|uniref:TLP18.3/Psb32/MOLO-1 phosphatase superfamily protein n=1 Tax=Rivibacter subsaxonicus TaxID=457575 RepID=A0A4Q7VWV7_9BURK|nr:TPM domain-containing protein [Rivibacter subsaxonicus]RZU01221.1 TLP18.3/Psb32/MOLO-1 phosphatase superfamily protein [Rivibacter subsaxonicus]